MTRINPHSQNIPQEPVRGTEVVGSLYSLSPVADTRLHATVPAEKVTGILIGMSTSDPSILQTIESIHKLASDPIVKGALLKIQLSGALRVMNAAIPEKWRQS